MVSMSLDILLGVSWITSNGRFVLHALLDSLLTNIGLRVMRRDSELRSWTMKVVKRDT